MATAILTMYATRLDIYIYFLKYAILVPMKPKDVFGVNYKKINNIDSIDIIY